MLDLIKQVNILRQFVFVLILIFLLTRFRIIKTILRQQHNLIFFFKFDFTLSLLILTSNLIIFLNDVKSLFVVILNVIFN